MKTRLVLTLIVTAFWVVANVLISNVTNLTAEAAGKQFENSDSSYITSQVFMTLPTWITTSISLLMITLLTMIWYKPVRNIIRNLIPLFLIGILFIPTPAKAYYDKQDYTEAYFILPNESAFFIPDVGNNRDTQAGFGSEEYLRQNKIPAKRFTVPHAKLSGSAFWADFYVPTGRLIIVDRSPFNREWVSQGHRGTSTKDESFPCQSKEGLNLSVGIAIGTSVSEENVAKYLYRFGVKPPQGDRTKPEVIFTSVFYGRSLNEVMDGPIRSKVQSLVCDEFTKRSFDEGNSQAAQIMKEIEQKTSNYLINVGITLEYIGWADTFTFDPTVQGVINRRYVAQKEAEIAQQMAPHTQTLQALALAEATRTVSNKWDGKVPNTVSLWWFPTSLTEFMGKITGQGNK